MNTTIRPERAADIAGVPGRLHNVIIWPDDPKLPERCRGKIASQVWASESRSVKGYGPGGMMTVTIRHDDNCKNGHETFSITADVITTESKRNNDIAAGGCMHDEIVKVFPELAHLIKWHLCSTDGPMHYIVNTTYAAGCLDYNGLLEGERRQIRSRTGELCWRLVAIDQAGNEVELYQLEKNTHAETKPACPYTLEYRPWCTVGKGKARELESARSIAIWPEATDDQLKLPKAELTKLLEARLPALLADFRQAVESCGFMFTNE